MTLFMLPGAKPARIISDFMDSVPKGERMRLACDRNLNSTLKFQRRKISGPRKQEPTSADFEIDADHCVKDEELVVKADYESDHGDRFVILSTDFMLKKLGKATFWVMDGTFRVSSSIIRVRSA